ncbi:ABC transporter permease [Acetivibrio mesophilus]|uniref:Transport permease protein n=1 Tax=Acetivibrio mesophilus TaxID=2487273 RepID=A0A4Q0IC40_9FIRM|nr:ABC transporter permease [Acetivibrio mesophilus]ODM26255.1 ABC transporter [Clostridium sp. Bc-iso-3]RXE60692.1 ABC transporter permease [Acetivibrio mesophilus]HHV28105.1 ABC transporter permease [Clostridium sp.]
MKTFKTLFIVESKLEIRRVNSIFFGVFFPLGMILLMGVIFGKKPAFEGASYTALQQTFGALSTIGICATGLMGLPLAVADYRDKKVLKRFKVTPVSPSMLLFTQVLISFIIAVISTISVFIVASVLFGYRFTGSVAGFLISYLLITLVIYGMGMFLASISPNLKTASLLCSIAYFPMLFLSGATVPYEIMPRTMQQVVNILPLTQGIKMLKNYSLGLPVTGLWFQVAYLGILALICIVVSVKVFKWE